MMAAETPTLSASSVI